MRIPGFLLYNGIEIVNNVRTVTNLAGLWSAGTLPKNFEEFWHGDYGDLAYCPEEGIIPGIAPWSDPDSQGLWGPPVYPGVGPSTPWHDAGVPESDDFFGFFLVGATGFDGEHHVRAQTPKGGRLGGAAWGPKRDGARTIGITLHALARNAPAMAWGMEWLEDRMLGPMCDTTCEESVLEYRTHCPTSDDYTRGFWRVHDVTLQGGPRYGAQPLENGCVLQTIEFNLGVGDPCRYGTYYRRMDDQAINPTGQACNLLDCFCSTDPGARECYVVPAVTYGSKAFRIRIKAGGEPAPGVWIYTVDKDGAALCGDADGEPITRSIITRPIPAGGQLEINTARQTVRYFDPLIPTSPQFGSQYLSMPGGVGLDWPRVYDCDSVFIVEPIGGISGVNDFTVDVDEFVVAGCASNMAESVLMGADHGLVEAAP